MRNQASWKVRERLSSPIVELTLSPASPDGETYETTDADGVVSKSETKEEYKGENHNFA